MDIMCEYRLCRTKQCPIGRFLMRLDPQLMDPANLPQKPKVAPKPRTLQLHIYIYFVFSITAEAVIRSSSSCASVSRRRVHEMDDLNLGRPDSREVRPW